MAVGAWIARVAFVGLLLFGWTSGELRLRGAVAFAVLGAAVWVGMPFLPGGGALVTPALAIIDIALVFAVFKGDVRIT